MVALFAATLFLSAFLMFSVEPMIAKLALPLLGGAPMVWNTCVVFFQLALLGGYGVAYLATRWSRPELSAWVYVGLVLVSLLALPLTLRTLGGPPLDGIPIPWLLAVLATSIGLPFLALSSSTSMLQKMFAATDVRQAGDPYFLYAAGNAGGLAALLMYPTLVEPLLRLSVQRQVWTIGYGIFTGLALICVVVGQVRTRRGVQATVPSEPAETLSWGRRARWIAFSFIPSSLMLGVTTYLSTDIASAPLLWIVPLALYLLTLVVAFSSRAVFVWALTGRWLPLLVVPLALFFATQLGGALWFVMPLHLAAFTIAALGCHAWLAGDRPFPARLAEFYLCIAVGGVLGGVFNTILAPLLFTNIVEYPVVLIAACVACLAPQALVSIPKLRPADFLMPLGVGVAVTVLFSLINRFEANPQLTFAAVAPLGAVCFSQKRHPLRFAAMLSALMIAGAWAGHVYGRVLYSERTFFGVYRVTLEQRGFRSMYHGTTLHGMQSVDAAERHEPLTYYHKTGPFGQAWSELPYARAASDIAIVGLGVGTLASYVQPNQRWTFYEIDPAVERIARAKEHFTFLDDCGSRCQVVVGDARRSLALARPLHYGVIVLDAFSSDAIPVHLMTQEAVGLYLSRLAPQGILVFHISNRHLQLGPVLARIAGRSGLTALERTERLPESAFTDHGWSSSNWVVMARQPSDLGHLAADPLWRAPIADSSTPLWTDDYSDLVRVIRFR